jgi:hypothetical protein
MSVGNSARGFAATCPTWRLYALVDYFRGATRERPGNLVSAFLHRTSLQRLGISCRPVRISATIPGASVQPGPRASQLAVVYGFIAVIRMHSFEASDPGRLSLTALLVN